MKTELESPSRRAEPRRGIGKVNRGNAECHTPPVADAQELRVQIDRICGAVASPIRRADFDFMSWNGLDADVKELFLPFLGEAVFLDDWEKSFVRQVWERGDGAPLPPAHLALMDDLLRAGVAWVVNTTMLGVARR